MYPGVPEKQGLYDPQFEHDSCGVGFIADMNGQKSHAIVRKALQVLINLEHRGAKGCEVNTGDGAGITMQIPDKFLRVEAKKLGITSAGGGPLRRWNGFPAARSGLPSSLRRTL